MTTRKKPAKQINTFLAIKVNKYDVAISASINYEVRDPRHYRDDARVYVFETRLEIEGICTHPEGRAGEKYQIDLHGTELRDGDFSLKLADCIKRDEQGEMIERKVRGMRLPVYEPPNWIGMIERNREDRTWMGWVWVSPQTVTDMLIVLPTIHPLYLDVLEYRIGRKHRIGALALKSSDPSVE